MAPAPQKMAFVCFANGDAQHERRDDLRAGCLLGSQAMVRRIALERIPSAAPDKKNQDQDQRRADKGQGRRRVPSQGIREFRASTAILQALPAEIKTMKQGMSVKKRRVRFCHYGLGNRQKTHPRARVTWSGPPRQDRRRCQWIPAPREILRVPIEYPYLECMQCTLQLVFVDRCKGGGPIS